MGLHGLALILQAPSHQSAIFPPEACPPAVGFLCCKGSAPVPTASSQMKLTVGLPVGGVLGGCLRPTLLSCSWATSNDVFRFLRPLPVVVFCLH